MHYRGDRFLLNNDPRRIIRFCGMIGGSYNNMDTFPAYHSQHVIDDVNNPG